MTTVDSRSGQQTLLYWLRHGDAGGQQAWK